MFLTRSMSRGGRVCQIWTVDDPSVRVSACVVGQHDSRLGVPRASEVIQPVMEISELTVIPYDRSKCADSLTLGRTKTPVHPLSGALSRWDSVQMGISFIADL